MDECHYPTLTDVIFWEVYVDLRGFLGFLDDFVVFDFGSAE